MSVDRTSKRLVKRLHEYAGRTFLNQTEAALLKEAAAEIERLRTALEKICVRGRDPIAEEALRLDDEGNAT